MEQELKELLIKDLCARLPYGVKFHYTKHSQSNIDQDCDGTAIGYYCNLIVSANDKDFCVDRCKLYLRPITSMIKEESEEYFSIHTGSIRGDMIAKIDFYIKHHFDFRLTSKGLSMIEAGFALEAPEGMYK